MVYGYCPTCGCWVGTSKAEALLAQARRRETEDALLLQALEARLLTLRAS